MNVFITGGTGFIGQHLIKLLNDNGYQVVVATRNPTHHAASVRGETGYNNGDENIAGKKNDDDVESDSITDAGAEGAQQSVRYVRLQEDMTENMQDCRIVINLAGETLFGKRWSTRVKKRLYDSRIDTTRSLVSGMRKMNRKPDVFLSASGVNYYGDCGSEIITEEYGPGKGFLTDICRDWENEAREAESMGVRVVNHRFGVALGTDGGALATMLTVFKSYIGGAIGPGSQYFPWIHIDDLCRALLFSISTEKLKGPVNTTAPNPITMNEFSSILGKILSRPSMFYVPEMAIRLALGEAAALATTSLRVVPEKLQQQGFTFKFPTVDQALSDLLAD